MRTVRLRRIPQPSWAAVPRYRSRLWHWDHNSWVQRWSEKDQHTLVDLAFMVRDPARLVVTPRDRR